MYAIIGNNMQLYINFALFIGGCVPIQCQHNNGDIVGIVIGSIIFVTLAITIVIILIIIKVKYSQYSQYLNNYSLLLTSVHACSDY